MGRCCIPALKPNYSRSSYSSSTKSVSILPYILLVVLVTDHPVTFFVNGCYVDSSGGFSSFIHLLNMCVRHVINLSHAHLISSTLMPAVFVLYYFLVDSVFHHFLRYYYFFPLNLYIYVFFFL